MHIHWLTGEALHVLRMRRDRDSVGESATRYHVNPDTPPPPPKHKQNHYKMPIIAFQEITSNYELQQLYFNQRLQL